MARTITPKQKKFADKYLETGHQTNSALAAYDTKDPNAAHVIASENLQKLTVQQYLEEHANRAAVRVVELSNQEENLPVALGASKDILDRAGYKPVERSESKTLSVEVKLEHTELDKLREEFEAKLKNNLHAP